MERQIDIARQKGGISAREKYTLERFEVVRHITTSSLPHWDAVRT